MRKFRFNKLVRDKIVDGMRSVGGKPNHRVLNNEEFKIELIRKIQEEAKEFELQPNDDIVELLADVQEVLDTLRKTFNISPEAVIHKQKEKIEKNGGFENLDYVGTIDCPNDYPWISFYEANSEKYPEIKD